MTADARIQEFVAGKAIPVAIADVDKELALLWRQVAAQAELAGERRPITRACLWNLAVRVAGDPELARAKRIVDEISPAVPARVLVLDARPDDTGAGISAWVEANWHRFTADAGSAQIGSDEVTLRAGGGAVDDLAQVVRALLLPDVPTAALWSGGPPSMANAIDRELRAAADRLVFDSACPEDLARVAAFLDGIGRPVDAVDLAWVRLGAARSLLATLFDRPSPAAHCFALTGAKLVCRRARLASAHLLAGWLASRLGWRAAGASDRATFRRPDGGPVEIAITVDEAAAEPLGSIELQTECDDSGSGRYALTFEASAAILETPAIAWKDPLSPPSPSDLWIAALSAPGRDPLFVESLHRAPAIPG